MGYLRRQRSMYGLGDTQVPSAVISSIRQNLLGFAGIIAKILNTPQLDATVRSVSNAVFHGAGADAAAPGAPRFFFANPSASGFGKDIPIASVVIWDESDFQAFKTLWNAAVGATGVTGDEAVFPLTLAIGDAGESVNHMIALLNTLLDPSAPPPPPLVIDTGLGLGTIALVGLGAFGLAWALGAFGKGGKGKTGRSRKGGRRPARRRRRPPSRRRR